MCRIYSSYLKKGRTMNLFYTIKQTLPHINQDELLRTMGYNNLSTGHETLEKFIASESIYLWLKTGHFDMKYSSQTFLQKLLAALGLGSQYEEEIEAAKKRLDAVTKMKFNPYIFVDTNFRRKGQPIFTLALLENKRRIPVDKELLVFKDESEVLIIIGNIIKKHYLESNGKLQLWGEIYTYVYHHYTGKKYIFNPDGTLSKHRYEISESKAEMRVGNKTLTNLNY